VYHNYVLYTVCMAAKILTINIEKVYIFNSIPVVLIFKHSLPSFSGRKRKLRRSVVLDRTTNNLEQSAIGWTSDSQTCHTVDSDSR